MQIAYQLQSLELLSELKASNQNRLGNVIGTGCLSYGLRQYNDKNANKRGESPPNHRWIPICLSDDHNLRERCLHHAANEVLRRHADDSFMPRYGFETLNLCSDIYDSLEPGRLYGIRFTRKLLVLRPARFQFTFVYDVLFFIILFQHQTSYPIRK